MHASRDSLILSLLLPALAPKMIKSAPILRLILALIPQGTGWGNSHCGPVLQSTLCPQRARCLPLLSCPCSKSQPAHKEPRHGGIHHPCPNRKCLGKHISDQRVAAEKAGEHSLHSRDGEVAWNTAVLLFVLVLCQNVMTRRIEREQRHRGPIISRLKHRRCLGVHESLCELQHCWKVSQEVTSLGTHRRKLLPGQSQMRNFPMAHVNGQRCYLSVHHVLHSSGRRAMALHPILTTSKFCFRCLSTFE